MKKIIVYAIILFVAVGLSGVLYLFDFNQNSNSNLPNIKNQDIESSSVQSIQDLNSLNIGNEKLQNQNVQIEQKSYYSLLEVEKHNSKESCWTVIRKEVYDLTNWISKHPGGEKAILDICGKDGTVLFENQHAGQDKPESTLLQFKIGQLLES